MRCLNNRVCDRNANTPKYRHYLCNYAGNGCNTLATEQVMEMSSNESSSGNAKNGGNSGASTPRDPNNDGKKPVFGEKGTQMTSSTVWSAQGGKRIDVENPNPGQRPGQIHYQNQATGEKYLFNPETKSFNGAPNRVNNLLNQRDVQNGINKGLRFLGEKEVF